MAIVSRKKNSINPKRTSIGRGKVKLSSMNKQKRKTHKTYLGQGK